MACPILRKLGNPNGEIPEYGGKLFLIGRIFLVGTYGNGFDHMYPSGRVPIIQQPVSVREGRR